MTEMLDLPAPVSFAHFLVVKTDNGVSLDFAETTDEIQTQHYAFLVTEKKFDEIFQRIKERKLTYWADPFNEKRGEINHHDGGRGVYFNDPSGHKLEVITRPYGSD